MIQEKLATKVIVVFDTMVYREIGRLLIGKSEEEKRIFRHYFFKVEKELGYEALLNALVVLELIRHLSKVKDDKSYKECKEAIVFAIQHSKSRLLHPPFIYFADKFFLGNYPQKPEYSNWKKQLNDLLENIATGNDHKIAQNIDYIEKLVDYNMWLKEGAKNNIQTSIEFAGNPDRENKSAIHPGDKEKKREVRNILRKYEEYYKINAEKFYILVTILAGFSPNGNPDDIKYLFDNHKAAFQKNNNFNEKLLDHDNLYIDNPNAKQSNNTIDSFILFSLSPIEKRIFITGDRDNIKTIKKANMDDWLLTMDEYFEKINLEEIKSKCFSLS